MTYYLQVTEISNDKINSAIKFIKYIYFSTGIYLLTFVKNLHGLFVSDDRNPFGKLFHEFHRKITEPGTKIFQEMFDTFVVTLSRKSCHMTPILKELHWLPVSQRIVLN